MVVASRIFVPEPAAASFRLAALVAALIGQGADVEVLTVRPAPQHGGQDGAPRTDDAETDAHIRRWPVLRDATGTVRGYVPYLSFDIPLFFRLLLCRRPDVVVVEPPPTTAFVVRVVCTLRRIPYVSYAPDVWSDAARGTPAPRVLVDAVAAVESWALRGARRVLAVSQQIAGRVEAMGVDHESLVVVNNGADTRTFTPDGPRTDEGRYFVYAGTTSEWQGADVFVDALRSVLTVAPDVRIVFIGQGSAWEGLQEQARDLPEGSVVFMDAVAPAEAAVWIRGALSSLVSLRPGLGYDFAFPTKVFAAAASGVPVVFAGVGPARDVVAGADLGYAVEYDEAAVAEAMTELATRETDREARTAERTRLSRWARRFGSIERSGEDAARAVLEVAARGRSVSEDRSGVSRLT
ncbi:glycosyltransferase [Sanguibacter keddieii DSM 10542]|uniref:D-inositol 3-phosphate glycosyltransferase n=1 Tax=Sanguibacter keddieii (strain ATCC 51767 / DSM 10542 / NCFB 3025 / ST-74) TaxID=446469 RepID=D1BC44_SANKS|nr:glycosyltransferase [Sanguibacter keddieii]ACZ20824.1 glycosyltransferase [Sanguibacter keddieii DSM 10542]